MRSPHTLGRGGTGNGGDLDDHIDTERIHIEQINTEHNDERINDGSKEVWGGR